MKYDNEYSTASESEMRFLREHGIRYTWVFVNEEGCTVWKYKKELRLWEALTAMYSQSFKNENNEK